MQSEQPSKTALGVAKRRAAHQIHDFPLVLEDPLALRILDPASEAEVRAATAETVNDPVQRGMRFHMALRSRIAEDRLAEAVSHGVRQYVVLGAGLDTSAYRCPFPDIDIFEVDHPATQAWKRHCVADAGFSIPPRLTYAPVDFEHQSLREGLEQAGFRAGEPAFFSWLGVLPYLTRPAALSTLAFLASLPATSGVVFDYSVPHHLLSPAEQRVLAWLAARVAAVGEPFRLAFEPSELEGELRSLGFNELEDMDAGKINLRYLRDRPDGFQVYGKGVHCMCAWV